MAELSFSFFKIKPDLWKARTKKKKKEKPKLKKKQTKNENFKLFIHISCSLKNLFKNISVISDCENKFIGNFILKN